jgi:hypothetical protein
VTTVIPFLPSNLVAPSFRATLDGTDYDVEITWNVSAQRYYINIYGLDGTWIITTPLVQTPPARKIQSIVYDIFQKAIIVTMVDPSLWPVPLSAAGLNTPPGTIVDYTLENCDPTLLNQKWRSLHINNLSFSFQLPSDPGSINILGSVNRLMNMISGVFQTSTLIYRNGAFEVTP